MVRARIRGSPLTAAAALAWSDDLPCQLQQVLFDTADGMVC
jgi:non-ribosomal peptide synthetase component E (peptide arylation enzyme)